MSVLFNVIAVATTTSVLSNTVVNGADTKSQIINTLAIWVLSAVVIPLLSFIIKKVKIYLKSMGFMDDDILVLEIELKRQLYDGLLLKRDEAKLKGQHSTTIKAIEDQIKLLGDNIKSLEKELKEGK